MRTLPSRDVRRAAERAERRAASSGRWGAWKVTKTPGGVPGGRGWSAQIVEAWTCDLCVALVRPMANGMKHLAIRTTTGREPTWGELQRIKNEVAGPELYAVQFCPPMSRLIDGADMYHLWVYPAGYDPGFGLHEG